MKREYDIFVDYICNYIIPNRVHRKGIGISIGENIGFRIRYNHKIYNVDIIQIENQFYWRLTPHFEKCYTTIIDDYSSFDRVLFAIKENDRVVNGKK